MKVNLRNVKWTVSAGAGIALITVANVPGIICAGIWIIVATLAGLLVLPDMDRYLKEKNNVLAVLLCAVAAAFFNNMWQYSSIINDLATAIGITRSALLVSLSIVGAAAAYYAVRCLLGVIDAAAIYVKRSEAQNVLYQTGNMSDNSGNLFLLLAAIVLMTICSKSSPIYVFNDWVDSNCFFTVGKSMANGKVLYRDIYEQKGLYLYVIHMVAYLISNDSFFGVYLFETLAAFAFLKLAHKITLLFCRDKNVICVVPGIAALVYGAQAFCHGDSVEEYCLPLLAYAIWVGIRAVQRGQLPEKKECILIGITSGCVLWLKYSVLGFYLGWYAAIFCCTVSNHRWKDLCIASILIVLGVAIVSFPAILYFAGHDALSDLWIAYFYNNTTRYAGLGSGETWTDVLTNIFRGISEAYCRDALPGVMLVGIGLWYRAMGERHVIQMLILCMSGLAATIFAGKAICTYYALVFGVFMILALPPLLYLLRIAHVQKPICVVGGLLISLLVSNNVYMLRYQKQDLPQYAFKQIIEQIEEPTLLNYGFLDGGFYTVCEIVPNCKYFCQLNIDLQESVDLHRDYLNKGKTHFVVTCDEILAAEKYECVATHRYEFENKLRTYRLYALKELKL